MRERRLICWPSTLAAAGALLAGPAGAQVIERNLPPAPPVTAAPAPSPPPPLAPELDDRPIGPPLRALVALGPDEPARSGEALAAASGIELAGVAGPERPGAAAALRPLLGRPLSRRLIAEAQAAVTKAYRRAGFPFVSVTAPEQEISGGVLQLRVIAFRAGRVRVSGVRRAAEAAYVASRVRTRPGDPIDARRLSDDLDWLNRNPFRQVQASFSPGDALGRTDLTLTATSAPRAFQLYGGYAQSGSAATGRDRYILGAQAAGLPFVPDALLSYQFTGAQSAFQVDHPQYVSHAARLTLPLLPRQAVELSYDHVETNQPVQDFVTRQVTDEVAAGWRGALSDIAWPSLFQPRGDVSLGMEARQSARTLLFGGQDVQHATVDVFQVYTGYTGAFLDRLGSSSVNVALHVSPGGFNRRNTDASLTGFSQGRNIGASYAYGGVQFSRVTRLPWRLALSTEVIGQYAGAALPDTEQIGLGGPSLVRGYALDDGAFDSGVIARNAVVGPALRLLPSRLNVGDALQPRLFVDAGYGFEREVRRDLTAVSVGLGADYRIGARLQLGGDLACPLRHGPYTRSGDCRVEGRLNVSY